MKSKFEYYNLLACEARRRLVDLMNPTLACFFVCCVFERGDGMSRKKSFVIAFFSAVLAGLFVYGIYLMQLKHIHWQETVRVVVPKQFIDSGTMITPELVEYKPIFNSILEDDMILDMDQVIGMEALIPLGEGEPILNWKLNHFHLLPKGNQSTFQIPKSYILSISNQIRAGDQVYVYLSSADGSSRRLFSEPVVVASVKMASNQEVEDGQNSSLLSRANGDLERLYVSRRNANGPIDFINLNLTEEQWLELDRLCKIEGNQLVIAYNSMKLLPIHK